MYKKQELQEKNKPNLFGFQFHPNKSIDELQNEQYSEQSSQYNNGMNLNSIPNNSGNTILINNPTIDIKRLNRAKYEFNGITSKKNHEQDQPERKQAVKMDVFRESARQRQRQFHQQNHEYLRMFSVIAISAMNENKFRFMNVGQGSQNTAKGQNKTSKLSQNFATVHLQLFTELTSSLINYNFPVKDTYNIVPFKKQSIEFESRLFLDPKYQFFVFQKSSQKVNQVKHNLQNVLEQTLSRQFKGTVIRTIGNLDFFEFLDLVNNRSLSIKSKQVEYPKQILQIAYQNEVFELNSDEEEYFMRDEIIIEEEDTNERIVACEDFDLEQTAPSVYFEVMQDYTLYKKCRQIEFKNLNIYDKDISINTDIRNIISSQKIYLIQLVKELDLYIKLSTYNADISILKQIHRQLKRKSEQFLKLICGYTETKILKEYNIENYPEKIMGFIEKSIKYKKQINRPSQQLLQQYPILRIWYQIPRILFGYSRQKLHQIYYQLVEAIMKYEQKINRIQLERQLSKKKPGQKYPV